MARPGFTLDATNAAAIADICRRLDGIPLAIELAAARVSAMRPADIAARVDERFRLLTGGRRTAVERHQTLRAAVDWSYALLTDTEQRVFARLGVFVGGFDPAAAGAGTFLQRMMIEDSCRRGDRLIDLGPGSNESKRHWQTRTAVAWRYTHYALGSPSAQLLRILHALKPQCIANDC